MSLDDLPILPTTIVGSYPKPKWLNKAFKKLQKGKMTEEEMQPLFEKAILQVIEDHKKAGVDIISDGEMRRTEMVEFFAENIDGFDIYDRVRVWGNVYYRKPAVIDKVEYVEPMLVDEYKFLRAHTEKAIKVPITGPYTIADWSFNEHYDKRRDVILDLAEIIHTEVKNLQEAGAKFIQIDEPALSTHPQDMPLVQEAMEIVTKNINVKTGIHICYGDFSLIYPAMLDLPVDQIDLEFANSDEKNINLLKDHNFDKELGYGCIDVHDRKVESLETVVERIHNAFEITDPKDIYVKPDCGLKMLSRDIALEKLKVMVEATKQVRKEL